MTKPHAYWPHAYNEWPIRGHELVDIRYTDHREAATIAKRLLSQKIQSHRTPTATHLTDENKPQHKLQTKTTTHRTRTHIMLMRHMRTMLKRLSRMTLMNRLTMTLNHNNTLHNKSQIK